MAKAGSSDVPSPGAARNRGSEEVLAHSGRPDHYPGDPEGTTDDDVTGRRFGRYVARGSLARGGMGEVLAAWDPTLERSLALKVMRTTALPDETRGRARFVDEAKIGARLDHPGIVPVHDLGHDDKAQPYFTMRLVEGHTLQEILARTRDGDNEWNLVRVLGILLKVCEAMAFAHDRGIVHRDLKPANIMVGPYGEVYVMDWGLAHRLGEDDPHDLRPMAPEVSAVDGNADDDAPLLTMQGDVIGTPAFMSPEQALGQVDALGPRTDVFAAGSILYQVAAGAMPHVAPGERVSGLEVWRRVRAGPPQPISELAPELPSELVAICEKAMARDIDERYPDMAALADDLRAYLEGRVVSAHRTGALAEFRKWVQRNRGTALTISISLAVVVLGSLAAASVLANINAKLADARDQALAQQQLATDALIRESSARHTAELAAEREELARLDAESAARREGLVRREAVAAAEREIAARREADEATALEALARRRAEQSERSARWQSYRANLSAASAHLQLEQLSAARERLDACDDEFAGWEFEVLELRQNPALHTWSSGPFDHVRALALSPDGSVVASGGSDGKLRMRDLSSGELLAEPPLPGYVLDLAYSSDGRRLIVAENDSSLTQRDAVSGALLVRMNGHQGQVNAVAVGPRGERLASASNDGTVRLWNATTGDSLAVLDHDGPVFALAFSPDGELLASAGARGVLSIWEAGSGRRLMQLEGHTESINSLAFVPTGELLLSGSDDRSLRLWEPLTGKLIRTIDAGTEVLDVAVSPGGKRVLAGCDDGSLRLWETAGGRHITTLRGHLGAVHAVAFTRDGHELVSASTDGTLRVWDEAMRAGPLRLPTHDGLTMSVALSAAGDLLASGSFDKGIVIREALGGDILKRLQGHQASVMSMAFALHGTRLASTDYDGTSLLWDVQRGVVLATLHEGRGRIAFVTAGPDGQQLALAVGGRGNRAFADGRLLAPLHGEREIRIFDADDGALVNTLPGQRLGTTVVAYSGDGRLLASGSQGGGVALWSPQTGELLTTLSAEPEANQTPALPPVSSLALDERGKTVVSAHLSRLYSLVIWDGETGEQRHVLTGHETRVWSVALTPDGRRLLSTGEDGTVRVWDTASGEHLLTLTEPELSGLSLSLGRDGKRLVSTGSDGSVVVWDTDVGDARALRSGSARRALTERIVAELLDVHVLPALARQAAEVRDDLSDAMRARVLRGLLAAPDPTTGELNKAAWAVARTPGSRLDDYAWALRRSEIAVARAPERAALRNTLGVCLYRLDRFEEALAALARADAMNSATGRRYSRASDLLVMAMCLHHLGRADEASMLMTEADDSLQGISDQELLALRAEAEQLLSVQ